MGDVGDALSGLAGGIGSALSGVGSAMSGGASDIGSAMSSMMSGSAAPGQTTDPAQSFQQAVDPSGSVAASEAINPPGAAPSSQQSQQGTQQQQPPPKPAAAEKAPEGALDELRKLLQGQNKPNPYQAGGGAGAGGGGGGGGNPPPAYSGMGPKSVPEGPIQDPLMPSPLGQATNIDTSGITRSGQGLGLRPGDPEPPDQPQTGGQQVATRPGTTQPAAQPAAPEIGPGSAAAAGGIPALARGALGGLASVPFSATPAETGELPPTAANIPPDQRNMPYPGQQYRPDPTLPANQPTPPGTTQGGPGTPNAPTPKPGSPEGDRGQMPPPPQGQGADAAGQPQTKAEYEKWLKAQGVKPSDAKKRADDSDLPTKKPKDAETPPYTGGQRGVSNITRDRAGMQGVPAMLGQLAQLAMPLISGLMSGGMGGGRGRFHGRGFPWGRGGHGRFGGPWSGGHPGGHGSGMYPYHHPGMGWSGFNHHPGGGWMPLHPKYMASMGGQVGGGAAQAYGDQGGGDMSQLAPILQALGINVPGGGQGGQGGFQGGGRFGGGGGQGGGGGASGGWRGGGQSGPPQQGPWSSNPFLSTIVQAESGGRQGPNVRGDGGLAKGFFQFHDATWQNYARNVPGASQYRSAEDAPPEVQQAVAMSAPISEWGRNTRAALHARFGQFDEHQTIGQLSQQYGGGQGGGATPPGTVATGDARQPNPTGNNANPLGEFDRNVRGDKLNTPANLQPSQVTPSWSPDA
ncbi:MAG TPA: hypothetical protein VHT52_19380 [Stellaceae bacterium]|jgi:hypothetical protein|nr:hypothetical protein [Stellaceae bacterium]